MNLVNFVLIIWLFWNNKGKIVMNTDVARGVVGNTTAMRAEPASRARSLRPYGPGWHGLALLLLFLLYPALPNPAMAHGSCNGRANCAARLDRSSAEAAAPSYRQASTTTDGSVDRDTLIDGRRRLTMKRTGDVRSPIEFEICGPQPLVDIFVEELEFYTKDLAKFDIYEIIAVIKEYFPCN